MGVTSLDDYDWAEQIHEQIRIDVRLQGDEWIQYIDQRISETTGATAINFRANKGIWLLNTPTGGSITSSLFVRIENERPICYVVGSNPKTADQISPWIDAVRFSASQIGQVHDFLWWAIVGEDPDTSISPKMKLAERSRIGDLDLFPSQELFFELRPRDSLISGSHISWTFPVHVSGSSIGYDWTAASRNAVIDLKIVCSLLSLASGRIWRLRQAPDFPSILPGQQMRTELPTLPRYSASFPERLRREDNYGEPVIFEMPEWINGAWRALQRDQNLAQLVATYHESLLLSLQHHDSYGLLAAVAIVEAIGNKDYEKLPRCPKCKIVTGSTARFRSALRKVVSEEQAIRLAKVIYGQRSSTAHDGILHGTEFITGEHGHLNLMSENPEMEFADSAREFRQIAAALLRAKLVTMSDNSQ